LVLVSLLGIARPTAAGTPCEDLTTLALPDTAIVSALTVVGYCRVQGLVAPAVRFELWLPDGWNGKLEALGNGGFAGLINTAGMTLALARGYATVSTDTGHVGSPLDASWALGHPELVVDFGHRGVHVTTAAAKAIVEAFYGVPPSHSYFVGCSTGGKQGLTEAQRYPEDYDGIVAGDPANFFTHLTIGGNWVSQALHEDPASVIPVEKLPAIANAVLARCDARDGVADGLLTDPRRCHFNPTKLRCRGAETAACLTRAQVRGLKKVYAGAHTSGHKRIFPGYVPGGELNAATEPGPDGTPDLGGWATWIAGTTFPIQHLIQDSFFKYMVFEDPGFDWRTFDFDRDVQTTDAKMASILDATDPDLEPFRARGGKLLVYHGWSDPAITPLNSIDYRDQVVDTMRRVHGLSASETDDFFRLFMVPGMHHCAGGPGPTSFNVVGALEAWVEHGVAPDSMLASHHTGGVVDRARPLCPYPQAARYDGAGDPDDAASFACR
jgi:feruloyl esterase